MATVNLLGRKQDVQCGGAQEWRNSYKSTHRQCLFVFQAIKWASQMGQQVKALPVKTEN